MSIATDSLSSGLIANVIRAEKDCREIAKEYGFKIRKHPRGGIDVTYEDGRKEHYHGWLMLRGYLYLLISSV